MNRHFKLFWTTLAALIASVMILGCAGTTSPSTNDTPENTTTEENQTPGGITTEGDKTQGEGTSEGTQNQNGTTDNNDQTQEGGASEDEQDQDKDTDEDGQAKDSIFASYSSVSFADAMTCGWNLGNTLDAHETGSKANKGLSTETSWGMLATTKKMIDTVANKGFKTIRIPISWHNHITNSTDYTIDPEWMNRVKTIVDWSLDNDMFVIINIHHDNLKSTEMSNTYGFSVNNNKSENDASKKYITKIWEQIAGTFKNYDHRLVFELLNEPRNMDLGNPFNPSSTEEKESNAVIKTYEQAALDVVRASGGNNPTRFVMVPYYAASPWKSSGWALPKDSATDKLLISTHAYDPYQFAMYDGSTNNTDFKESVEGKDLKYLFDHLNTTWVSKGHGVVMGEGSCTDKNNLSDRLAWFESYVSKAKAISCPLILWDNMQTVETSKDIGERHGYFDRKNLTWFFPTLVEKMIQVAGGTPGTNENNNNNDTDNEPPADTGDKTSGTELIKTPCDMNDTKWGIQCKLEAEKFSSAGASSYIKITYEKCSGTPDYASLKLTTYWEADGTEHSADGILSNSLTFSNEKSISLGVPSSNTSFTFNPTASSWTVIKEKGLILYGYGIKITSIELY